MDSARLKTWYRLIMRRHLISLTAGLLLANAAVASCPTSYTPSQLGDDLSAMSQALRNLSKDDFRGPGEAMVSGLPCVDAPLAPVVLASIYRYGGLSYYFNGDTDNARRWFRTALELDPTYDWDVAEVPIDDPVRPVFEGERAQGDRTPEPIAGGRTLSVPDGYRLLVDGRALRSAALTPDRPHLVQLVRVDGNVVETVWLIDGSALPESLLSETGQAVAAAAPATGGSGLTVERIERTRPPMKTPALVGGGLLLAGGAGLYAMSFGAHSQWESATTSKALSEKQALTNGLVIGAITAVTVGAGVTWVGVSLDGGSTLNWGMKF